MTVVIPTLNEAANLERVLPQLPYDAEIIVVDGGSVDGTTEVVRRLRPNARLLRQTRRGKGNALICGMATATGDIIVTFDADGSADPSEIPRFVLALVSGADFAKGSRFLAGGGSSDLTHFRRVGNSMLMWMVNSLFGTEYTDLCYGFNAVWADCREIVAPSDVHAPNAIWGDGFEIETLISVRAAQSGLRVTEVPSFELSRITGSSNLHTIRDGFRVLHTVQRQAMHYRRTQARLSQASLARPADNVLVLASPLLEDMSGALRLAERTQ